MDVTGTGHQFPYLTAASVSVQRVRSVQHRWLVNQAGLNSSSKITLTDTTMTPLYCTCTTRVARSDISPPSHHLPSSPFLSPSSSTYPAVASGEHCKKLKSNVMHFSVKICYLLATVLIILSYSVCFWPDRSPQDWTYLVDTWQPYTYQSVRWYTCIDCFTARFSNHYFSFTGFPCLQSPGFFSWKFQDLESLGKTLWSWKVLEIEY